MTKDDIKNLVTALTVKMCECEKYPALPEHDCPYKQEMGGDDPGCECCESCMQDCAWDV